ncbi:MAG: hypothetical protein ACM3WU_04270 [Bacillota bacterium]
MRTRRSRRERLLDEALWMESLARVFRATVRGERLTPISEIMEKAGITQEMLDQMPKVELEDDHRNRRWVRQRLRRNPRRRRYKQERARSRRAPGSD